MQRKIVVVGSINLDLVASVERMPQTGETISGQGFATYPGGKGANQAVAAARLGAEVVMVGRLGNDLFATQLRAELKAAQVETDCVLNVEAPSGTAIIMVTPRGDNSIVVVAGANDRMLPQDLEAHVDLFREASIILAQLEIPIETVERLAQMAGELGVPFLLDPAPARELPAEMLKHVTWLTPNESETRAMLGHMGYAMAEGEMDDDAVAQAAERILGAGVRNVILKLGGRGIYLSGKDAEASFVPPYSVRAVDTTAAGDAFNGGFAYGLMRAMSPMEAAKFACAVAAVSVTHVGAQPSMPTLVEVEALMGIGAAEPA